MVAIHEGVTNTKYASVKQANTGAFSKGRIPKISRFDTDSGDTINNKVISDTTTHPSTDVTKL